MYRLQMCVLGVGESVDFPIFSPIIKIKEVSVPSGGAWKQVFEIYYLRLENEKPVKGRKK